MLSKVRALQPACEAAGVKLATSSAELGGVKLDTVQLSTNLGSSDRFRVQSVFGEHPRELIAPEVGLRAIQALCAAPERADRQSLLEQQQMEHSLVEQAEALRRMPVDWQFVLNANPLTRAAIERTGDFCLRDNPNGVDLNRNFDDHYERAQDHGSGPFSEPEAKLLRDSIEAFKPDVYMSVHSGRNSMYTPHAYEVGPDDMSMPEYKVLEAVKPACDGCTVGQAGRLQGIKIGGSSFDWAKDVGGAKFSYAYEVFIDPQQDPSNSDSCFRFFNPSSAAGYAEATTTYANALLQTARLSRDTSREGPEARADAASVESGNLRLAPLRKA